MAKTSMSEIARIIGQVARLDAHGKRIVRDYLVDELEEERSVRMANVGPLVNSTTYEKGNEQ